MPILALLPFLCISKKLYCLRNITKYLVMRNNKGGLKRKFMVYVNDIKSRNEIPRAYYRDQVRRSNHFLKGNNIMDFDVLPCVLTV